MVEQLNDPRFLYFWKPNEERAAARNYGLKYAKGIYINYFDSDDIAQNNHLLEAYNTIQNNNSYEVLILGMNLNKNDKIKKYSLKCKLIFIDKL